MKIVIINYGAGNIQIMFAIERFLQQHLVTIEGNKRPIK
jgi:hypothetical protein